jgi:hypothetical protein
MAYTIKQFNPYTGQITVEFNPVAGAFSIDLPLTQEGLYVTGDALVQYINGFEPKDYIDRKQKVAVGIVNSAEIAALAETVYTEPDPTEAAAAQIAAEQAKAAEMEKYVKAGLIKYGLITE